MPAASFSTEEAVLLADAARHPTVKTLPVRVPGFVQKMLMEHLQKRLINPAAVDDTGYTARLQHIFDTYSEAILTRTCTL